MVRRVSTYPYGAFEPGGEFTAAGVVEDKSMAAEAVNGKFTGSGSGTAEAALGNVMVDCGDAAALQRFYGLLLGWEQCRLFGRRAVRSSGGVVFLFAQEPDYVPPVWPEEPGAQQKQMHFDFQVESVPEAVKRAEALGAVRAAAQFGADEFTTMLDPAGHPFCLCRK